MFGKKKSNRKNGTDVSNNIETMIQEEDFSSIDSESSDELVLDEENFAQGEVATKSSEMMNNASSDFMVSSDNPFSMSNIEENVLLVGNGTKLKGEISNCDKLIIEGSANVSVTDVVTMHITSNGTFDGKANVQDAVIEGQLSGELTVHGILTISSGGTVSGTINYKQLRIEEGGEISGNIIKNAITNKKQQNASEKPSLKAQFVDS